MRAVFHSYHAGEDIPALAYLQNRKLLKYLNREAMASIVALGELKNVASIDTTLPCYYATGMLEYQDYGLEEIMTASRDDKGRFSPTLFINSGIAAVSPLNQFKVLQNMPLSFAAINFGLTGDNAVLYAAAGSLLNQALCAPGNGPILLGAGKVYRDSSVVCGFSLTTKEELADSQWLDSEAEAVEMFRSWAGQS